MGSIVLLAKQSGKTSFSTLWQVKKALGTKKVGHTGTLDNFADGLLVLLSGPLTRLGTYITNCDKVYHARIVFGEQTDTLDPSGKVVKTCPLPCYKNLKSILSSFSGQIDQIPPDYSAIHVNGKRASDRIRSGESVVLKSRNVTIYDLRVKAVIHEDNELLQDESLVSALDIRVHCSKGTYIRSLARDIGAAAGSCAHTMFLRRTAVGPFSLENAAGFLQLPLFGTYNTNEACESVPPEEIKAACKVFTWETAKAVDLHPIEIREEELASFRNGKKMTTSWFTTNLQSGTHHAVFSQNVFCGIVHEDGGVLVYDFVYRDKT